MKNKISTFLTGFPDSVVEKKNNKKKRKKISSDPIEGKVLEIVEKIALLNNKYLGPTINYKTVIISKPTCLKKNSIFQ